MCHPPPLHNLSNLRLIWHTVLHSFKNKLLLYTGYPKTTTIYACIYSINVITFYGGSLTLRHDDATTHMPHAVTLELSSYCLDSHLSHSHLSKHAAGQALSLPRRPRTAAAASSAQHVSNPRHSLNAVHVRPAPLSAHDHRRLPLQLGRSRRRAFSAQPPAPLRRLPLGLSPAVRAALHGQQRRARVRALRPPLARRRAAARGRRGRRGERGLRLLWRGWGRVGEEGTQVL